MKVIPRGLVLWAVILLVSCSQQSSEPEATAFQVQTIPANVVLVDQDATGLNDGSSWENAFITLQDALDCLRAGACAGQTEIWLAKGVYYPDEGSSVTDNNVAAAFVLVPDVAIFGGFDGVGVGGVGGLQEERKLDRNKDPFSNGTVLSGDIQQDDLSTASVTEHFADIVGANSDHVVLIDAEGLAQNVGIRLDSLSISAATDGGLYCDSLSISYNCDVQLNNVRFTGNLGSALRFDTSSSSSITINNSFFTANQGFDGGAIDAKGITSLNISNSSFSTNEAAGGRGAAINASSTDLDILNGRFDENRGSVAVYQSGDLLIKGTTFNNNVGDIYGGAVHSFLSTVQIRDSLFVNNEGTNLGGAVFLSSASATLDRLQFFGNKVTNSAGFGTGNGGALASGGTLNLTNSIFSGNEAEGNGGAISYGGSSGSSLNITNSSFSRNRSDSNVDSSGEGGALYVEQSNAVSATDLPVHLTNNIFWQNQKGSSFNEIYNDSSELTLAYSLVKGGNTGVTTAGLGTLNLGAGLLMSNPHFIDANGADNALGTVDDNLRLKDSTFATPSPAIDSGDSDAMIFTKDLDKNNRFGDEFGIVDTGSNTTQSAVIDMGAYEVE